MTQTLILSAIDNLGWPEIRIWAESLRNSGYYGHIAVVVYRTNGVDTELLVTKCHEYGILLHQANYSLAYQSIDALHKKYNEYPSLVCRDRFFEYWNLCTSLDTTYDWVLSTDARDVIFQKDPNEFLKSGFFGADIIASCEDQFYNNESWGKSDFKKAYGDTIYKLVGDKLILNAGVIAVRGHFAADFFITLYSMCDSSNTSAGDQAAYNLLLNTSLKDKVYVTPHQLDWACQIGTTLDPLKPHLTITHPPSFDSSGVVKNYMGHPYHIVHQWDRNPTLKKIILNRYI